MSLGPMQRTPGRLIILLRSEVRHTYPVLYPVLTLDSRSKSILVLDQLFVLAPPEVLLIFLLLAIQRFQGILQFERSVYLLTFFWNKGGELPNSKLFEELFCLRLNIFLVY